MASRGRAAEGNSAAPAAKETWRIAEGEEVRVSPDGRSAEIWTRGFLPLRMLSEPRHHARPGLPGAAVVLGSATWEVLSETDAPERGLVVYRLRPWPEGEVTRDRVVYGPAFVRQALADRERARFQRRARPFRWLLYPLVGLLPEDEQARACDRFGLYAVTATFSSGLAESFGLLWLLSRGLRTSEPGAAVAQLLFLPLLALLVLPGLGRAFGAAFLRETGGSPPVVIAFDLLRRLGALRKRRDAGFVPLTRAAFWERLSRPDSIERTPEGALLYRGLLAHLSWTPSRRLQSGDTFWTVTPLPPEWNRGRLLFTYSLEPTGGPPRNGEPAPEPPPADGYAEEVLGGTRIEWDGFNQGFAWLTSLLPAEVQARAFAHRGGPEAARRPAIATAAASIGLGLYLLNELRFSPAADPLVPFVFVFSATLLLDGVLRLVAVRRRRYAPSLFRLLLPTHTLRPERVAYQAHRDAERAALLARS